MTGLAVLTGESGGLVGQLVLSGGRLCLAIPPAGTDPRAELDPEGLRTFQILVDAAGEARAKGQTFCETLRRGHNLAAMRNALRRQIAIGLRGVVAAGKVSFDLRTARDDYDPRFTFSGLDVFLATVGLMDDSPPDIATRVFDEYQDSADAALLFARPAGAAAAIPVAARGMEEASLASVVALGRAALGVALSFERPSWGEPSRLVTFHAGAALWVCVLSDRKLALIRTGADFGAGQILGFAAALVRRL